MNKKIDENQELKKLKDEQRIKDLNGAINSYYELCQAVKSTEKEIEKENDEEYKKIEEENNKKIKEENEKWKKEEEKKIEGEKIEIEQNINILKQNVEQIENAIREKEKLEEVEKIKNEKEKLKKELGRIDPLDGKWPETISKFNNLPDVSLTENESKRLKELKDQEKQLVNDFNTKKEIINELEKEKKKKKNKLGEKEKERKR